MKNKIVITGANGFVGRSLVKLLNQNAENEIIEVARSEYQTPNQLIIYDMTCQPEADKVECDYLIHCAAYVDSIGDWSEYERANVNGTKNVIEKFPAKTVIYISTSSVYTGSGKSSPFKEEYIDETDFQKNNLSFYGASKLIGEKIIQANVESHFIIRPHIIYGEGDTTLLPKLKEAIRYGRFIVPSSGKAESSITNIKNLTNFINLIIERNSDKFGVYNFSDKEIKKISELFLDLSNSLKLKKPLFIKALGNSLVLSILSQISTFLGKESRLNKYLVDSLNHDHVLDIKKLKQNFPEFEWKYDWENYKDNL